MRFGEQRKIIPCVALSLLLVIWGVSLGYFRALMLASGAANWSLTIFFIFLTIGLPLVQALFGHRHSKALERLNNSLEEQRKLQPQERKVQSELRELKRLREDTLGRRERLGKQVLVAEEKKVNRNNSEHVFLKTIEAKLTIYRQAYLHWQRKKPSPSFPIKSIQPRLNEKSIKSKEAQEWPKLRALPY